MSKLSALSTLREKLGEDGVNALFEVLEEEGERTRNNLFQILEEKFARRLAEELGKLRSEMYELFARHGAEMDGKIEGLRVEMHDEIGKLRVETYEQTGKLKADIIKWMFVFWATQMLAIMGILFTLFRFMR